MLRDFAKLNTFLTVVEEKSFSAASKKLSISQPAVTQQIKLLEDQLQKKLINRKKSGIVLTQEGEEFKKIVLKLKKYIDQAEKEVLSITDNKLPIRIGACMVIGEYVLPEILSSIKQGFTKDISVSVEDCRSLEEKLSNGKFEIIMISRPSFLSGIVYREWIDDEIVIFSNEPLPELISPTDLENFSWITREEDSHTTKLTQNIFESKGIDCSRIFNDVEMVFNNVTAVKNIMIKAPKKDKQLVSFISKKVIANELKAGLLFATKVKRCDFNRKFYIATCTNKKNDDDIRLLADKILGVKI